MDLRDSIRTTYSFLPAQRQLIHVADPEVSIDVCLYQGGFGSGKTWVGVNLGLLLCEKYPGVRGLVAAKTWPLIRDTTLETYFELFNDWGWVDGRDFVWMAEKKRLYFPRWGNSSIMFRHIETPWKLKSLNLGWAHLEEMSELDEADFDMVLSRLRQSGVKRYRLFGTSNPQARKGWIHRTFVENGGLHVEEFEGKTVKMHYRRVLAPTTENIHNPPSYVLSMKQKFDPDYFRINVMGQDGDYTSGLVVKHFSDENKQVGLEPREGWRLHLTCDFNVDPCVWVVAQRDQSNKSYYFIEEIIGEGTTVEEMVGKFAAKYPPERITNGLTINGDASGHARRVEANPMARTSYVQMRNRLIQLGYRDVVISTRNANPDLMSRIEAFNAKVCSADGVIKLFIDPVKCQRTTYCLENLIWKVGGDNEIRIPSASAIEKDPKLKWERNDPFDAISYMVEFYDPIRPAEQEEKPGEAPTLEFEV